MKGFIKNIIAKFYIYIFENRILSWVKNYKMERLKKQLNCSGVNLYIESPYKMYNPQYISISNNFYSWHHCRIEAIDHYEDVNFTPKINIGANVSVGPYFHIGCINEVKIGNNVLIGSKVFISDHSHGSAQYDDINLPPEKRKLSSKGPVIIGDNVWIGDGVCILPNVKIGDNAIIGANSVVTQNVAPNTVVGGVPAKLLKAI